MGLGLKIIKRSQKGHKIIKAKYHWLESNHIIINFRHFGTPKYRENYKNMLSISKENKSIQYTTINTYDLAKESKKHAQNINKKAIKPLG